MLRLATLIFLALPTAAQKVPPASDDEKRAAAAAQIDCLKAKARELDDGTSDAATVGAVIAPLCQFETMNAVDVFARGKNARVRYYMVDAFQKTARETGAQVVLKIRAERRAAEQP